MQSIQYAFNSIGSKVDEIERSVFGHNSLTRSASHFFKRFVYNLKIEASDQPTTPVDGKENQYSAVLGKVIAIAQKVQSEVFSLRSDFGTFGQELLETAERSEEVWIKPREVSPHEALYKSWRPSAARTARWAGRIIAFLPAPRLLFHTASFFTPRFLPSLEIPVVSTAIWVLQVGLLAVYSAGVLYNSYNAPHSPPSSSPLFVKGAVFDAQCRDLEERYELSPELIRPALLALRVEDLDQPDRELINRFASAVKSAAEWEVNATPIGERIFTNGFFSEEVKAERMKIASLQKLSRALEWRRSSEILAKLDYESATTPQERWDACKKRMRIHSFWKKPDVFWQLFEKDATYMEKLVLLVKQTSAALEDLPMGREKIQEIEWFANILSRVAHRNLNFNAIYLKWEEQR